MEQGPEKPVVYLGADPGRWKTALAVVARYPEHYRVLQVEAVDNAHLVERALELVSLYGVSRAVVERTSRGPWKRQVPKRELAEIAALGQALTKALEGAGVPVDRPLPSRANPWYGPDAPGWRQALTGLLRPTERDVMAVLKALAHEGRLTRPVPFHPHIADAIGMVVAARA